jgi:hypothetical protein
MISNFFVRHGSKTTVVYPTFVIFQMFFAIIANLNEFIWIIEFSSNLNCNHDKYFSLDSIKIIYEHNDNWDTHTPSGT